MCDVQVQIITCHARYACYASTFRDGQVAKGSYDSNDTGILNFAFHSPTHPYDHMVRARKSEKPSQPRSFIFTSKQGALPFPITSPPPFRHLIFFDWVWLLWTEHLFCRLFVRRWRSSVPNSSCLNRERRAKYLTPFVLRSFVGFRSWANRMFCHVSQSQDILQRNGSINASLARLRNLQFLPAPRGRWPTTKRVIWSKKGRFKCQSFSRIFHQNNWCSQGTHHLLPEISSHR